MRTFELKEGLYEYSQKRLSPEDRRAALARIQAKLPNMDPDMRGFLAFEISENLCAPAVLGS